MRKLRKSGADQRRLLKRLALGWASLQALSCEFGWTWTKTDRAAASLIKRGLVIINTCTLVLTLTPAGKAFTEMENSYRDD